MSTRAATATAVAKLFTAAGRNYADTELVVYHDALTDIDDDELAEATRLVIRDIDVGKRAPSPALVREYVMVVRTRQPKPDALEETTGPPVDRDEGLRLIAEARAANHPDFGRTPCRKLK